VGQERIAPDEQRAGPEDPRSGQLIRGKYRLTHKLSAGEMGDLYAAQQVEGNRSVAVKMFHPALSSDAGFAYGLRQIMGVVWGVAKNAPAIVTIYDCDVAEDGTVFIAMERVDGLSLATLLQRERPLPIERAVRLAGRIAGALGAAHMVGVVHGDLRPSNILIGTDDRITLVGFERARVQDVAPAARLERAGALPAHFEYRAPEHIRDEEVTPLADVYGLGLLFYEMLSGCLPFTASTASALTAMHLSQPPTPPRELRADIPELVAGKVLQALAKEPSRRQNHVTDVANASLYATALYYEGACLSTPGADGADPARLEEAEDTVAGRPRRRGRGVVVAGLTMLITMSGLWALAGRRGTEVPEYAPPRQALSWPPAGLSPAPPPVAATGSEPHASSAAVPADPEPPHESQEPPPNPRGASARHRTSNTRTANTAGKNRRAVPSPPRFPAGSRTASAASAGPPAGADEQTDPGSVINWLLKKPLGGS
jgi:eukaryotic-like serine/threonine-protein kinase